MKTEQKKMNIKYGDYVLLGDLLGITPDNARMRLNREKEDAIIGMQKIIENRERLQQEFKKDN